MPGRLVTELGNGAPSEFFALRLAVRALEAWLMADSEGVAQHFGVPVSKVPRTRRTTSSNFFAFRSDAMFSKECFQGLGRDDQRGLSTPPS